MAVLIIFKHLLAERIARSTHKEGCLQAKLLFILLVESGKAILWKNLIKTTMQIDIAIHINTTFFVNGIESHNIGSESPLSGLQGLIDKGTANRLCRSIIPNFNYIVGHQALPCIQTNLYLYRIRVITKPAKVNEFWCHLYYSLFLQRYEKLSKEQKKSRNICHTQLCLVPLHLYTI